jgi:hypothetical protein
VVVVVLVVVVAGAEGEHSAHAHGHDHVYGHDFLRLWRDYGDEQPLDTVETVLVPGLRP